MQLIQLINVQGNRMQKEMKEQRVPLMMEASLLEQIDSYRFAHRIGSRAEAMRKLMKESLETETPVLAGE